MAMHSSNPLELLIKANQGNKEAYKKLLEFLWAHSKGQIKSTLRAYKSFPTEAMDDIAQEILMTFHNTHQTFDVSRPFIPWINSIIRHKAIDFIRRKDFRVMMEGADLDIIKETWAIEEEEDRIGSEELLKLIDELPSEQSQILKLAKIEGFSSKEIAEKLQLSDSNVKVIIHRSVKQLKKLASSL